LSPLSGCSRCRSFTFRLRRDLGAGPARPPGPPAAAQAPRRLAGEDRGLTPPYSPTTPSRPPRSARIALDDEQPRHGAIASSRRARSAVASTTRMFASSCHRPKAHDPLSPARRTASATTTVRRLGRVPVWALRRRPGVVRGRGQTPPGSRRRRKVDTRQREQNNEHDKESAGGGAQPGQARSRKREDEDEDEDEDERWQGSCNTDGGGCPWTFQAPAARHRARRRRRPEARKSSARTSSCV